MDLDAYDFDLPEDRIALRPARPRDAARLLHVRADGSLGDAGVRDLPRLLRAGDVLVTNDTRVIPAALRGVRPARDAFGEDVAVDVNLFERGNEATWTALARPGRRLRVGDVITFGETLSARLIDKLANGGVRLAFDADGDALDVALSAVGFAPLPPYIARRRPADAQDAEDYQTIFARETGAAAAPTAVISTRATRWTAASSRSVTATSCCASGGRAAAPTTSRSGSGSDRPAPLS